MKNRLLFSILLLTIATSFAAAQERQQILVDQHGQTLSGAINLLASEYGFPFPQSIGSTGKQFDLYIDEPTLPRAIASLCEQAPAYVQEDYASPMVYLREAIRKPLFRQDFESGEVFLINSISHVKHASDDSSYHELQLSGVLLTEGGHKVMGVSTFINLNRVKNPDGWVDVPPREKTIYGMDNQVAWHVVGMWQLPDNKPVSAIEAEIHISNLIEQISIDIKNPGDSNQAAIEKAGVTCQIKPVNPANNELAMIVASGPVVKETATKLNNSRANRFVTAYDANNKPLDVSIESTFSSGDMLVRITSKKIKSIDHVELWWPTRTEEKKLNVLIDPVPEK